MSSCLREQDSPKHSKIKRDSFAVTEAGLLLKIEGFRRQNQFPFPWLVFGRTVTGKRHTLPYRAPDPPVSLSPCDDLQVVWMDVEMTQGPKNSFAVISKISIKLMFPLFSKFRVIRKALKRWDKVLSLTPYSGFCAVPIKLGYKPLVEPFYWVVEVLNDQASIIVKPVKGEPYRIGEVYGFYGFSNFTDFKLGSPIVVVEGMADWAAIRSIYPLLPYYIHQLVIRQAILLSEINNEQSDPCL